MKHFTSGYGETILKRLSLLKVFFKKENFLENIILNSLYLVALLPVLLLAELPFPTESEILESAETPLTALYGVPETNIWGVNVINGDYNYSCVDFDLPGSDPLVFQRMYSSSQTRISAFFHGWTQNFASFVATYCSSDKSKKTFHAILLGSLSGAMPFKADFNSDWSDLKVNRDVFKKGVTNCGKGRISGRTNIKNMKIKYLEDGVRVINPDGTKHFHRAAVYRYKKLPKYFSNNHLEKTWKPNTLRRTYTTYSTALREVNAFTSDNRLSNRIEFDVPPYRDSIDDRHIHAFDFSITGSSWDGKRADYFFKAREKKMCLENHEKKDGTIILMSAFRSDHIPSEDYFYVERHDGHEMLKERSGKHHCTKISYYFKGDTINPHGYDPEKISSSHIAHNRVKHIQVAVNNAEDLKTAFRFTYHKDSKTKDAFTDVLDARNHLTRYHYSTKNYRLNCVEKYSGTSERSIYRRDRLEYGAKRTPLEGDLLFKTIEDAAGTVHYGENYRYDHCGNVLTKKIHFRNFTGSKIYPISTEKNPHDESNLRLQGGEVQCTRYTYNRLNLPTSEDDGRLKTIFNYHVHKEKNTNLLKSKFVKKGEKTLRREFCAYDGTAGCIFKVVDDGSDQYSDILTDVNCRRKILCVNRQGLFAGLPEQIDVWGSNGGEEQRISRTVLEYDAHGYVEKEIYFDANDQLAYSVSKIRDLQGNVTCETDPLGQTTHRKYNKYGSLLEEHGPSSKYYTVCIYDWLQRPISVTRHCSDGIHLTTTQKYTLDGKLKETQDQYGFTTKMIYDEEGRLIETIYPPVRTEKGWICPREKKSYNFLGYLISETDAKGAVTVYKPNDAGLPLKISYPDGTCEKFKYSIYGEILEKTQRNGSKVVYAYDDFSRITSEETYDREGKLAKRCSKTYAGLLLQSEDDGSGLEKQYTYDYAGRVSAITHGRVLTKYFYDPLGRIKEEHRYFGEGEEDYLTTRFTYDLLNRVVEKKENDAKGKTYSEVLTTYDADGNIQSTETSTHAGAAITLNTYDARGNLSTTKDPLGNKTFYNQRYDYYFEGRNLPCLEVTDPAGVKTTTISDAQGNVIKIEVHSSLGVLLSDTDMYYDLAGNLVRKEHHLPSEKIVTLWEYDVCSRLFRQVFGMGTPEEIAVTFVYNAFGEQSETHYADQTSKHRIYDALGRLFEEWSEDKSVHYKYTYNEQGLLKTALNCNTSKQTGRKYSPEGYLLSEQFENGLKISYRYDRAGRPIQCTYPDGSCIRQTYNPFFLCKAERIKDKDVVYKATFSKFDHAGKPESIKFPKKCGTLSLKYNLLSRPLSLCYERYKEEDICYDKRGLLRAKKVNDEQQKYAHDALQQLILEKTALYSHTYENDALYRQTSVDGCAQTHNAVHQLTQGVHDIYTYDKKGRRTNDSNATYTYDGFDRLVGVKQEDSTWSYTYDAFNRKMSRKHAGKTTYYLYDGHEEIGSYNRKKTCIDLKVLSAGPKSVPIALEIEDRRYSPLICSQGHIVGLIAMHRGDLADYSPLTLFGRDLAQEPLSPWRFCGKRHEEAALGIIDFGFRFYHPQSGQWLTQDPLGESDGPNLYAYVSNNPASLIDRFGLWGEGWSLKDAWDGFKDACIDTFFGAMDNLSNSFGDSEGDWLNEERDMWWRNDQNEFIAFGNYSDFAGTACSIGVDFAAGPVKSGIEFFAGEDLVTGEEVSKGSAFFGLIPLVKPACKAGKLYSSANKLADLGKKVASGAKKVAKAASPVLKQTKNLCSLPFKPFTRYNFRYNLKVKTGISPAKNVHAHHVFPQEHAREFAKRGINVHDPKHGVWWDATPHWEAHGKFNYNEEWFNILRDNPSIKENELFRVGREIMSRYGKSVNF